ncbi:hypothetical protein QYS48_15675 [Marivirga arenosa]|uniref:Uncharacterized protein n=1 Tax=Marivirga arenosa TaxID=3059076 RepID=A0AA49JDJ4_9BACT|nr:hypothetical protein [Marivirga sp. ABR2-2]WKK83716.2 hypothetical protein QYS48_15675 [Marivirga sp. ABR2-2]
MSTINNDSGTVIFDNFSQMSTAMKGENTTNGWDVVCSYDLTKLNELLSEKYKQGKLVADIPGVVIWDWVLDFGGLNMTTYDFKLSEPVLNFNLDGRATLNMPISKISSTNQGVVVSKVGAVDTPAKYKSETWYSVSNGEYTELTDQSKIAIGDCAMYENDWYKITSIKSPEPGPSVTGTHSLVGSIPISAILGDNQIYNKGTIVVFKESAPTSQAHIVLHFSNKASNPATFAISPKLDSNFNKEAQLLNSITNFFSNSVNDIDYALNSIAPTPSPTGETMITPKSFVFNTVTTGNNTGVLSTYIATTQNKGVGQTNPSFTVAGKRSSPIPKGNTASMIFSQSFIQNIFLTSQLQKSLTDCSVTFTNLDSGIQANIHASNINIAINIPKTETGSQSFPGSGSCSSYSTSYLKVNNDVLSSNDYPITMILTGDQISLEWSIQQAGFNYETGSDMTTICPFYSHTSDINWSTDSGHKVTIDIKSNPNSPSKIILDSSDNIDINPKLSFEESTYSATVSPKPAHKDCWDKFWTGDAANEIHQALQAALGNFAPKISLSFAGINYFATTNILFPGGNIFDVDVNSGLQVPRDMVLLGNIDKSAN